MKRTQLRPAVIGKDGRTTAIQRALRGSPLVSGDVPCLSEGKKLADPEALNKLYQAAESYDPDFIVVGPEEPLDAGVVDQLYLKLGIRCVGPTQTLARLESSKAFTRELVSRRGIPGNPRYQVFRRENIEELRRYLESLGDFVIKPDGLTGGKGVRVSGDHLHSVRDAVDYARELLDAHGHQAVIAEEKLDGEEFSLQSFCDGVVVRHMPVVQDHKRARINDEGPNTGGMGSYSCADHRLPFLTEKDVEAAKSINVAIARALFSETNEKYKGILYGGFMLTRDGVRLIEYNVRFGDPEALNVLSLLKTDFAEICLAILDEKLDGLEIEFEQKATVCKYVVPEGYPDRPVKDRQIDLSRVPPESDRLRHYAAALENRDGALYLSGSRAIAFVGIGSTVEEAEAIAEEAASAVRGPVYHRQDIGTRALVQRRYDHINRLRSA
jgi:phosphoribosylamine--glycine ligase